MARLEPGRYPRHGGVSLRVWLAERLTEGLRLDNLAGTPWAARYARFSGHDVAPDARLGTRPPATGLVRVGAGATIEADVDLHGWWIEGDALVIGDVTIGAHARVGSRTLLLPGSHVGDGAEIEVGSVVDGAVPAGERWAGAPARRVGTAGEYWPVQAPAADSRPRRRRMMYAAALAGENLLPLLASLPGLVCSPLSRRRTGAPARSRVS